MSMHRNMRGTAFDRTEPDAGERSRTHPAIYVVVLETGRAARAADYAGRVTAPSAADETSATYFANTPLV